MDSIITWKDTYLTSYEVPLNSSAVALLVGQCGSLLFVVQVPFQAAWCVSDSMNLISPTVLVTLSPYALGNLRLLLFVLSTWISCIFLYKLDRNLLSYLSLIMLWTTFFFVLLVLITKFSCFGQYFFWTKILDLLQIHGECNFSNSI